MHNRKSIHPGITMQHNHVFSPRTPSPTTTFPYPYIYLSRFTPSLLRFRFNQTEQLFYMAPKTNLCCEGRILNVGSGWASSTKNELFVSSRDREKNI